MDLGITGRTALVLGAISVRLAEEGANASYVTGSVIRVDGGQLKSVV